MMEFLSGSISILVTGLLLAGFFGLAALVFFELGTVFLFWIKRAYNDQPKKPVLNRNAKLS